MEPGATDLLGGATVFGEVFVLRIMVLMGVTVVSLNLAMPAGDPVALRADMSQAALESLGDEYWQLQQWATAVAQTTDTLDSAERARVLADQLARVMQPLEGDFERTTAALSTSQLEQVLPLWERLVFAHAGVVLLQEQASSLGLDPSLDPSELHDLAYQLCVVLDVASEIQRMLLEELTTPAPSPLRLS